MQTILKSDSPVGYINKGIYYRLSNKHKDYVVTKFGIDMYIVLLYKISLVQQHTRGVPEIR